MTSTFPSVNYVQTTFYDNIGRGYPGQLVNAISVYSDQIKSYPAETILFMGRAVAIGTAIDQSSTTLPSQFNAPYTVTNVDGVADNALILGVALRPLVPNNFEFNDAGNEEAAYRINDMAAVVLTGSKHQVWVKLPVGQTVASGDAVYTAVSSTNDPGIEVGEYSNDSAGTTGLLLVPNATWVETFTSVLENTTTKIQF
jgi:hypothetical protein